MSLQEKAAIATALGVYFHIPFCAAPCDFCSFYQEKPQRSNLNRFLAGMELELSLFPIDRKVDTVFWGGGTPGLLPAADLSRLGRACKAWLKYDPLEWTVEMAPSTVKREKIEVMRELGVTRISLGAQSFDREILKKLGRRDGPKQIYSAVDCIYQSGFENLNIDMMFALPGQSLKRWEKDLGKAIALQPKHISTYCLTFEEDTPLYAKLSRGEFKPHSEEMEYRIYSRTMEILGSAGYQQYEVSNYAKPGFTSLHNMNTWRMQEWLGFGPSASSQYGMRRFTNPDSLELWLVGIQAGKPVYRDEVELDEHILAVDSLIFGIRMNAGVNLASLAARFPTFPLGSFESLWRELEQSGHVVPISQSILKLTPSGRLVADRIALEILERGDG